MPSGRVSFFLSLWSLYAVRALLSPVEPAPEEYLCRMETLHELMAVLDTCTEAQRRRFLLYALDGLSLAEIGVLCGCSKVAVYQSVEAVRKKFINFFENRLNQVKGIISLISARGGQRTSCPPLRFSGGKPMKTINLRWMYPHYRHDEFVDVTDEVWAAMYQAKREMENYERRKVYHRAYYSLDAYSWLENYALEHSRSSEDILLEREEMTTRLYLIAALPVALAHATPTQARRVHAYYIAGIKQPEIARREGIHSSKVPSTGGCGICAVAMMSFFKQSEGVPMQTINLKQYYPFCKEDIFVEVSDEIVEAFLLDKRAEGARERKMFRYKAFYSLDCNDGIENAAIGWAQPSPEDHLIEKEELAEYEELIRRLYEAIFKS